MPGPPLSDTFTYDGTPGNPPRSDKFNRLDRVMIQTQRFFNSKDTGTHARVPKRENIQDNPNNRIGVANSHDIQHTLPADQ